MPHLRNLPSGMLKKTGQQGRSEAHGATNKEHHVCARRRVGEAAVSWAEGVPSEVRRGSERCENEADDFFQHPASRRK